MKELSFEKMESLNGGGFWNMFCNAAGAASFGTGLAIASGFAAATGGIGYGIMAGVALGCLMYGW